MGSYREAATGGTYRKATSSDPRMSDAYVREKRKADDRTRRSAPTNPMEAIAAAPPFPVLDELVGGMAAVGDAGVQAWRGAFGGPGPSLKRAQSIYLANKDAVNEGLARNRERYPVSSFAGGLLTGLSASPVSGATATPTVTSTAKAPVSKLLDFMANAGRAGRTGAIFGGAYGLAEGDGGERLHNAATGAATGAVLGPVLYGAGTAIAAGLPKVTGAAKDVIRAATRKPLAPGERAVATPRQAEQAAEAVARMAQRKGLTPDAVRAVADERFAGKPVTAAEIMGREGVGQLSATARRAGSTADELEAALIQRQRGAPERIMQDFADDLGVAPASALGNVEDMVAAGRKAAAPLYDDAYAVGGVNDPRLDILRERPSMRSAMSRARTIAAEEGLDPTDLGFRTVQAPQTRNVQMLTDEGKWQAKRVQTGIPGATEDLSVQVENPTARTWDYVKRGLDDQLEGYRNPISRKLELDELGRAKLDTLTEFRGILREINPKYAAALDTSGDYMSLIDAMNTAKGKVMRGSVRDFGRAWASAKTPAAQSAFRAQLAQDVLDAANSGQLRAGKFTIPGAQQKLELAFGRDGAQRFVAKMEAEASLARTGGRMMPGAGSPTYELAEAGAEPMGRISDGARILGKFGQGKPISGTLDALGTGLRSMVDYSRTAGLPVEVRDEFGRILMMSADEFAEFLASRPNPATTQVRGYLPSGVVSGEIAGMANQ